MRDHKLGLALLALFVAARLLAAEDEEPRGQPSAFRKPALAEAGAQLMQQALAQAERQDWAEAERLAERALELAPFLAANQYNFACLRARQGKADEALASLQTAIEHGFVDARHIEQDADLASLRELPRFAELLAQARAAADKPAEIRAEPHQVKDGVALVSPACAVWDPRLNVTRTFFAFPPPPDKPADAPPVIKGHGEVGKKLAEWFAAGTAAGHRGDLYDNCDRDHSNLNYGEFPQLARIEYAPEIAKETGYGLQVHTLHGGVVIGNSSTAQTAGPFWRSNPRRALVSPRGAGLLYLQYLHNHLYFYPEHRDHDPGRNGEGQGHGDVYAANTPYLIISQGSSGSDRAFMDAVACTLAAFPPATKQRLIREGLLMPAVQQIFRRSNKPVARDEDYFTGAAHPTVFEGSQLNVPRMIELAHEMQPDALPPLAQLKVLEEDQPVVGRDYFDVGPREILFDTPSAIARVHRTTSRKRRMVLSAAPSRDADGRPLTFRWVVLRGDPAQIEIRPRDERQEEVEIVAAWQPRRPVAEGSPLESNRVDIGLFAHNGVSWSPPAFLSISSLDNEARTYDEQGRIKSVVYSGGEDKGNYADPLLDLPKTWRDDYRYDEAGQLLGWTRTRGERQEEFTADGALVQQRDPEGRPLVARRVRYVAAPRKNQPPALAQEPAGTLVHYAYAGAGDLRGRIAREEPTPPAEPSP